MILIASLLQSTAALSRPRCRRCRARRTGAAVVEMAIVTPLLLLLTFASADFGLVSHTYVVLSNAARCGAEYGSTHGFTPYTRDRWEAQIQQAVVDEMQGLVSYQGEQLSVIVTTTTDSDGLVLTAVEIAYPFHTVVDWPGIPSTVLLTHRVEMRRIR